MLGDTTTAPQISAALAEATTVTMSVGGNDIGFTAVVAACLFGSDESCAAYVRDTTRVAISDTLPAKLDRVYTRLRTLAPHATVQIVGYPRLFDASALECATWSMPKRIAMNEAADLLSETIARHAAAAGFSYVDVRPTFAGHEVCSPAPWIRDAFDGAPHEWLHPTAAGHTAQAALLVSPQPSEEVAAWDPLHAYTTGDRVQHNGRTYECIQTHQSWGDPNWINAPSLWRNIN